MLTLHPMDRYVGIDYGRKRTGVAVSDPLGIFASALDENAEEYFSANLAVPALFVFGNEVSGISSDVLEASDHILYIPMAGHAESLNVSAASAVILFEALKARMK